MTMWMFKLKHTLPINRIKNITNQQHLFVWTWKQYISDLSPFAHLLKGPLTCRWNLFNISGKKLYMISLLTMSTGPLVEDQ